MYSAELECERLNLQQENARLAQENQKLKYRCEDLVEEFRAELQAIRTKIDDRLLDALELLDDLELG